MMILTDMTWLGPWGFILFLASIGCAVIAGFLAVTGRNSSALLYLMAAWVLLALAVVDAAFQINGVIQFIKTKQTSPQFTPIGMLLRIWRATAIAVTVTSTLSLPVLIRGVVSAVDRRQRLAFTLAGLAAFTFACANSVAVILMGRLGGIPSP